MSIKKIKLTAEQITRLKQENLSQKKIAEIFEVTQQTIIRWKNQKPGSPRRKKRKLKTYGNIPEFLKAFISKSNTNTQQKMADYVSEKIDKRISQQTISRILRREGITYKKLTYHYIQLDEVKAKAFNEEIKLLLPKFPFIALDECSFYPNIDPRFGYSLKGIRAVSQRPSNKGKHYTLLFAISNLKERGVVHWKLIESGADWKVFYDFLEEINPIGNQKNYLLMDNARIHIASRKRKELRLPNVKEQMWKKNIEVLYFPPYAPVLNPTELVFNLLRQQTEKQRPRSYEEMKLAIEKVVDLLNIKDLSKYFWHCANYFDKITYNGKHNRKNEWKGSLLPEKRRNIKQNIYPKNFCCWRCFWMDKVDQV